MSVATDLLDGQPSKNEWSSSIFRSEFYCVGSGRVLCNKLLAGGLEVREIHS